MSTILVLIRSCLTNALHRPMIQVLLRLEGGLPLRGVVTAVEKWASLTFRLVAPIGQLAEVAIHHVLYDL